MTDVRTEAGPGVAHAQDLDESLQLLQRYGSNEFSAAERLIVIFSRQPHTISGFPRVRPSDCQRITDALDAALAANSMLFKDPVAAERFEAVVEAYSRTDVRAYASEYQRVLTLRARTRLLRLDMQGASAIVAPLANKPYAIEQDVLRTADIYEIDLQCLNARGDFDECARLAMWRTVNLIQRQPKLAWTLGWRFARYIGVRAKTHKQTGFIAAVVWFWAHLLSRSQVRRGTPLRRKISGYFSQAYGFCLGYNLLLLSFFDIPIPWRKNTSRTRDIFVTRAMGGLGDLMMMTPGLRALSKRHGAPVKMVVPKKFFDVFANNPYVELVDMDGPPVDLQNCRQWFNLSLCPATAYEAPIRPYTKKGRVELFAAGLGVGLKELNRHGQHVEINLDDEQRSFVTNFLLDKDIGKRPIIGVQPFSREIYRNYPAMNAVIRDLAKDYDVVVFHHLKDGYPTGPNIHSTASFTLKQSFAMASCLDVLVSVDSSFLHAASAFDIPVVALFGPIDGHIRTKHLKRVDVLSMDKEFPCAPCWRNEDEDCLVTRNTGQSPCLAAIPASSVRASVDAFVAKSPKWSEAR